MDTLANARRGPHTHPHQPPHACLTQLYPLSEMAPRKAALQGGASLIKQNDPFSCRIASLSGNLVCFVPAEAESLGSIALMV